MGETTGQTLAMFATLQEAAGNLMSANETESAHTITELRGEKEIPTSKHELKIEGLISDLALILVLGAIITLIFKKLKQPMVLGYIVAGFLASSNFKFFPSVADTMNIEFWAQIGIIVLLFSLGLEFSFKKLMNVGGSVVITTAVIVGGMMTVGFATGRLLHFNVINSLFLGGMISMSSTTIILKALTDLNMRHRRFTSMVFGVLICEDLFAVVMMVLLSSVALNHTVAGSDMVFSVLKLVFFLVIWFTVGVYLIPTIFNHFRRQINDEMMLIISMGLCLLMAIFSVYSGFSMALGAFIMGSILAGTSQAEHIEKVVKPVKDLFGAVFFISVGMMVDTTVIVEHWQLILVLSLVVILGMIIFGTLGMLLAGQSLRIAIESGFSLTQIGEFSFIIAALGMSLQVLNPVLYPTVVAVSVITTFFTPYFIKGAIPFYEIIERHLPEKWSFLLNNYTKRATQDSEMTLIWKAVLKRYTWRILLYSVLLIALVWISVSFFVPVVQNIIGNRIGKAIGVVISLIIMAPFFVALMISATKRDERSTLKSLGSRVSVPLVVMNIIRSIIAFGILVGFLGQMYSYRIGALMAVGVVILLLMFVSKRTVKRMTHIERRFFNNLNERELRKSGKENNLVSDFHIAYITVGYTCHFVGERLENSNIRKNYGVNVVSIQRGAEIYHLPGKRMRIFPGDVLGIIGTDEQIQNVIPVVEDSDDVRSHYCNVAEDEVEFTHIAVSEVSPLLGKTAATAKLREAYSALLVSLQRGEEYLTPTGGEVFQVGDILWLVGNRIKLKELKEIKKD